MGQTCTRCKLWTLLTTQCCVMTLRLCVCSLVSTATPGTMSLSFPAMKHADVIIPAAPRHKKQVKSKHTLYCIVLCILIYKISLSRSLTAPCMPDRVTVSPSNSLSINITWTSTNKAANYTVTVIGSADGPFTCQSNTTYCQVNGLSCGSSYQVTSIASTAAGLSMPSYSIFFQTGTVSFSVVTG